jgi:SAM-dependent methyltransferase
MTGQVEDNHPTGILVVVAAAVTGCQVCGTHAQPASAMSELVLPPPSPWVVEHARLIAPGGEVLDVASGAGRHARYLLGLGHRVCCVDRDVSGLIDLMGIAEVIRADLEAGGPWPLGERRFAGVVVTNYLHRPILPAIVNALAPRGVLIYETFAVGNERFGRPSNPDFLLRPAELIEVVRGTMRIVAYQDVEVARPKPAMVQRIVALNAQERVERSGGF